MPRPMPNDSADNKERLDKTIGNFERAEAAAEFASGEERSRIKEKNERRKESIEDLKDEIGSEEKSRFRGY